MRLNKVEFHEKKIGKKKSNVLLIDSTPSFFLSVIVQFIYLFIYLFQISSINIDWIIFSG